jgi:hypothetical protein
MSIIDAGIAKTAAMGIVVTFTGVFIAEGFHHCWPSLPTNPPLVQPCRSLESWPHVSASVPTISTTTQSAIHAAVL